MNRLQALVSRASRLPPSTRGMVGVVALKASVVALNFALIFLAARALGSHDFGTYSIVFSAAGLFCVAANCGQQMLVVRSWSEYAGNARAGLLKGSLIFSTAACVLGAAVVSAGFWIWLGLAGDAALAGAAACFVFFQTLVLFSLHLVRMAVGIARADVHANLTASAPPLLFLLACLVSGHQADVATVFAVYAAGLFVALAIHLDALRRTLRASPVLRSAEARFDLPSWRPRSVKLWLSSVLEASNQYLDVLVVGLLLNPSTAGAYFVTTRLANIFAAASNAVHIFSTRHVPELFFRNDSAALAGVLNAVAWMTAVSVAGGSVILLGAGEPILAAFNPAYAAYFPALVVLGVGTAAVAAVGPSGPMLMLTGHEGRYLRILATSIALRAAGFFVLIPAFGLMGAVVATSLSLVVMALHLHRSALALVGLNCSATRLLRPWRAGAVASSAPAD